MPFIQDLLRVLRLPTNSRRRSTRSRRQGFSGAAESVEPRMMLTASFTTSAIPMQSAGMLGLVAGDFNNDTNPDFAVSNNSGFIDVVSGNGNGTFAPHADVSAGVGQLTAFSIASGNITGTAGFPQLIVGSYGTNQIRIMNNAGGTFAQGATINTGAKTRGVAVGSLDNDLDTVDDIVAARYDIAQVAVFHMNSDGTVKGSPVYISTGANPTEVLIADLDGDGKLDIVTANETAKSITVIRNMGGGTYAAPITLVTSGSTGAFGVGGVHAANFDGAGGLDLVVTNPTAGTIDYFQNTGGVSFTLQQTITVGGMGPAGLTSLNFAGHGDGKLDLAVACRDSNEVRLFRNDGGNFVFDGSLSASSPFEIVTADFNKDGHPDLAASSQSSNVVTVLINSVNVPPVITGGPTALISVAENQTAVTIVTATDANVPAQTLTYSITGGADQLKFSIVAGTGVLTFVAAPDFETKADANNDGVYEVQVTVTDSGVGNLTDAQDIAVTVTDVNESPIITSGGAFNVAENTTAVTTVTATDPEGVALTYAISGGLDSTKFSINPTSGVLTFDTAPDFELPADNGANNVYDVTVSVTDGVNPAVTMAIAVTVTDVNESPIITSGGAFNVAENTTAVTTVTATDPEAVTLTYAISGGLDSTKFSINPTSGVLTFDTAPDFELPADDGANNVYDVTVSVTDGVNPAVTMAIAVTVTDVNESPIITSSGAFNVAENTTAVTTVTATDPEAVALTYAVSGGLDSTKFSINPTSGVLTFDTAPDFELPADNGANNIYDVIVSVTDGVNPAVTMAIAVTVTDVATGLIGNGIDVQNGQTQRSFVQNLDILFGDDFGLSALLSGGKVQLTRYDLNGANPSAVSLTTSPVTTAVVGNNIRIDFGPQGIGGNRNSNLGDGYYEIGLNLDGNPDFETTRHFYRLFGDVTGNGIVNGDDKQQILAASGTSSPESDMNGDGTVNVLDTALMSRLIGRKLKDELWGLLDD